jgi:indole-3-glycerol phosphate synthase
MEARAFAGITAGAEDGRTLFENALSSDGLSFICEIKRASPSKGIIAEDFPYLKIAEEYAGAGAAAVSVLTEPDFFKGSNTYLTEIAGKISLPLLRKDFTIDSYQIYEAKLLGASAILLICALLDKKTISDFIKTASTLGLSAIVEAHDETEIETALAAGAEIVGVNNRDLKTFNVDIGLSLRLRRFVPDNVLFVAESGIQSADDVKRLAESGVDAALVGEALMRAPDKAAYLDMLRGHHGHYPIR